MVTHYDNLKVSRIANDARIRSAYRKLAQKHHPDKFSGSPAEANRIMRILNDAKATLLDPVQRRAYDLRIIALESPVESPRASSAWPSERTKTRWRAHQAELRRSPRGAAGLPPRSRSARRRETNAGRCFVLLADAGILVKRLWRRVGEAVPFSRTEPQVALGSIALGVAALAVVTFLRYGDADHVLRPPAHVAASSPNLLLETKPTVGFDLDRSGGQIRYCLAEEIRLDAIGDTLDRSTPFETEQFNFAVADYNGICRRYTYRQSTYEIVKSDVAARRLALVSEGLARLSAWRRLAARIDAALPGQGSAPGHAFSPGQQPAVNLSETLFPAGYSLPTNFIRDHFPGLAIEGAVIPARCLLKLERNHDRQLMADCTHRASCRKAALQPEGEQSDSDQQRRSLKWN